MSARSGVKADQGWQPMESAPKDRPILAWCDHVADPGTDPDKEDRLTIYSAHAEGFSNHAPDGWNILEWGGAWEETDRETGYIASLPDWWFVRGSDFEIPAHPIAWQELPPEFKP